MYSQMKENSASVQTDRRSSDGQRKAPVISVIVPVYNVEKYLVRCVNSILEQTYRNLEIILVDDCSTDGCAGLIAQLAKSDDRIKAVRHEVNRGLFQARLTGYKNATGDYIAFVDSDDYISVDWFRALVRKAEDTGSDITVGEWCFDHNGDSRDYCNLDHFRLNDYCLAGKQIMDNFMAVQGKNFSWTVIWNKLYSRALWERCYDDFAAFSETHGHMLMWEDIAFSSALWMHADKAANVHGISYFYFKHNDASTHLTANRERNLKYIRDASAAISFMGDMLKKVGMDLQYQEDYKGWRLWALGQLCSDLVLYLQNPSFKKAMLEGFPEYRAENHYAEPNSYFFSIMTPVADSFESLEAIKKEIAAEKTEYVSFDVFDTLIQRPFLNPTDLFQLLSESLNHRFASYVNFKVIREAAEQAVRHARISVEEVTLAEIYDYIREHYVFDAETVSLAEQEELELELQYCTVRQCGKELLNLAVDCGKKVVICSDMYLPGTFVAEILKKNGISHYEKLYLSSDIKRTKVRKSLYRYVQQDLGCKNGDAILHIGDNLVSDVENARACGWRSAHLPKAADILMNSNPEIYGGTAFRKLYRNTYFKEDYRLSFDDFTSVRTMAALTANRFFDNPFVSVHPQSDFNADPRLVGYGALGPHLLALCQWIHSVVKARNIGTVHFVARDGHLVKRAYDSCGFSDSRSNYLRLSRKALILCDIQTKEDLYSLQNKMWPTVSPKTITECLMPIIPAEKQAILAELFEKEGIKYDRGLKDPSKWAKCLKLLAEDIVDFSLLPAYKKELKAYFSQFIKPGDYIFDIGYSGRPESALSSILGFPVGSLYIHVNSEIAAIRQEKYHCPCEVFYDFKPSITGTLREHLLMELAPSTVGYRAVDGKLEPEFEPYAEDYCSAYVTRMIQDNALRFVQDYTRLFHGRNSMLYFQSETASAMFEYYLHYSRPIDRRIVSPISFEDDLNNLDNILLLDRWNRELSVRNIELGQRNTNGDLAEDTISELYVDGYMIKFIRWVNKKFPKGGREREILKRIAGMFDRS